MQGANLILGQYGVYQSLKGALTSGQTPQMLSGLSNIHKAHFISSLYADTGIASLVLTQDETTAVRMAEELNRLIEGSAIHYPERDFVFRDVQGVSMEYEHARLSALCATVEGKKKILVASASAALQYTIPPDELADRVFTLKQGQECSIDEILHRLIKAGYERVSQVEGICQFSLRGGILDLFPPQCSLPVRIEFFGDEVDTISAFEIETQRRTEPIDEIDITPAREVIYRQAEPFVRQLRQAFELLKGKRAGAAKEHLAADIAAIESGRTLASLDRYLPLIYEKPATLLDYNTEGMLILCEAGQIRENLRGFVWQMNEDIKVLLEEGILFKGCDQFSEDFDSIALRCERQPSAIFNNFVTSIGDIKLKGMGSINAIALSPWGGNLDTLVDDLKTYVDTGYRCIVAAGQEKSAKILAADLERAGFHAHYTDHLQIFSEKQVYVVAASLSAGFDYPDIKAVLISQGRVSNTHKRRVKRDENAKRIKNLSDLSIGDYVVHASHGIGVFEGIIKREVQGVIKDYIQIKYAGTDMLFVPVNQLDLVSKYIGGAPDGNVRLNRLNSVEWTKTKQRVKAAVADMAKELIELYSKRMQAKGHPFGEDNEWQHNFEERFPYEETDDQLRCIEEIKRDMQSNTPMDRLLCGDVGFGKTEVALRAAFKCVLDSKQCAVLVPTTILAWQHFETFTSRLGDFPVKVEMLSRFRTPKQQEQILKELKQGKIDIIIGTHRLVQQDVQFKDLGLCIIDEEQRFGVKQKEQFKQLRNTVDILNLSATPIPRTLNMAMSGIRDMSLIEEAPLDRQPVQTYVLEYDEHVISQAIRKELRRAGQVFYLHNRVDSIDSCAEKLQQMLPEARILVAHGKMTEEQLSRVWKRMVEQEADILVCTTIIETGVDMPNCNTLIVEDADRLGLSQMYQLRGRVGRSSRRAFAYLTFHTGKVLSEISSKRLEAIREFTAFGSGFRIAMRDLEIRGAGNILGSQQHGHMEAVGYEMYVKLLEEAIREQKGEVSPNRVTECLIDLSIGAHIPEEFISDLDQRIDIYKKIATIASDNDAMDVIDELIDRFGDPPAAVKGLIDVSLIRNQAADCGIREIRQQQDRIILYPQQFDLARAATLAGALKGRVLVNAGAKPYITVKLAKSQKVIDAIQETLSVMQSGGEETPQTVS